MPAPVTFPAKQNPLAWLAAELHLERQALSNFLENRHEQLLLLWNVQLEERPMTSRPAWCPDDGPEVRSNSSRDSLASATMRASNIGRATISAAVRGEESCSIQLQDTGLCGSTESRNENSIGPIATAQSTGRGSIYTYPLDQTKENGRYSSNRKSKKPRIRQPVLTKMYTGFRFVDVKSIVKHKGFEVAFAVLILMNSLVIAAEAQYRGLQVGYEQNFSGYTRSATDAWPHGKVTFATIEMAFGICFFIELIMKCWAFRWRFLKSAWNLFDAIIILAWLCSVVADQKILLNPTILRLARLARLLRMARLTRTFQIFDVLHLLLGSLKASASVLLWSLVLLFGIMMLCALLLNYALETHVTTPRGRGREEIFEYFGTFTRAFLSMFEVTMGNWIPICRLVVENVSEWFTIPFLLYRCVVGFAVLNVIRGVFLHETFKVAHSDDEIMIMQRERATKKHLKNMETFFHEADTSEDGRINIDEFNSMVADRRVQLWLSAMDLDMHDCKKVFDLLDVRGDGKITLRSLVEGFARMKGSARAFDMLETKALIHRLEQKLDGMTSKRSYSLTGPET